MTGFETHTTSTVHALRVRGTLCSSITETMQRSRSGCSRWSGLCAAPQMPRLGEAMDALEMKELSEKAAVPLCSLLSERCGCDCRTRGSKPAWRGEASAGSPAQMQQQMPQQPPATAALEADLADARNRLAEVQIASLDDDFPDQRGQKTVRSSYSCSLRLDRPVSTSFCFSPEFMACHQHAAAHDEAKD